MKIVHVVYALELGGIETMLVNIVNEQVLKGHAISILCINDLINEGLKDSIDKRVRFYPLKRPVGSKNPYYILKLNKLLYSLKADMVHLHSTAICRFVYLPFCKNVCVTIHDVLDTIEEKYLPKYKNIFAISTSVKNNIFERTGFNVTTVLNGINTAKISVKDRFIQKIPYRIVQVSRLMHEKKGHHILLEAIKLVKERGYNVEVDFIGDGPSEEYLSGLIKEYKLSTEVKLLGAKSQQYIFDNLCEYDLFVQPSIYEGFGLTVAEAMAAKVPVLVSENQGPLEIIDNGKYGYLFKNGDAKDCAEKIIQIIEQGFNKEMIESACARVEEKYSVKQTALNYIKEYQNIIISNN